MNKLSIFSIISIALLTSACGLNGDSSSFPKSSEDERLERHGKITGEGGFTLFGGGSGEDEGKSNNGIGVNSFLWRATLDTIGFMPIQAADPFGGVITTDYYEEPSKPGERYKINALILDDRLRADGIKITLFRQELVEAKWRDAAVAAGDATKIEDAILTRARELRIKQTGR